MKKILKNRIFIFALGILISSSISVLAQTYFPSNDVTYDNTQSGLSSNNVQGAIDELYNVCFPPEPITPDDLIEGAVTTGDGLYKDAHEEGRYIYKGRNVNNYITFNNETWRIVSVEADKTIKIMRDASIGYRVWDRGGETYGSNNWTRPADLNTYLNGSYLTETLNSTAQSQIVAKDWNIGSVTYDNTDLADQINDEKTTTWNGKVALITTSEYIRSNSNQSSCGTQASINNNYSRCKNTTWMYINAYWWTLSPNAGDSGYVFLGQSNGGISTYVARNELAVRPAVYLSSSVQITGGNGSSETPYQIK